MNFSAKSGISAINIIDIKKEKEIRNQEFRIRELRKDGVVVKTSGNETKTIAFAGVGRPIKESDCRVSILNFARRKAEKTVIIYPK